MEKLERQRELPNVIAVCLSAMAALGIFALPGLAASLTGSSLTIAYIVAGFAALPMALAIAELATAMPQASGTVVYLDRAFGPLGGTLAGVALWGTKVLIAAFAAVCAAAYLGGFVDVPRDLCAGAILAVAALLNGTRFRGAEKVQVAIVMLSVLTVLALAALGLFADNTRNVELFFSEGSAGFAAAAAVSFVAFTGLTKVASVAGEIRRPNRNVPAALLASLAIVTAIYALTSLVVFADVRGGFFGDELRPIHSLAIAVTQFSPVAAAAAAIGALALAWFAYGGIADGARLLFLMSRNDLLPEPVGRLGKGARTPVVAITVSAGLAIAALFVLEIIQLVVVASALLILISAALCISTIVLRESRAQWYQPGFRTPLYPVVPIAGAVCAAAALFAIGPLAWFTVAGCAGGGFVLYLGHGHKRAARRGVIGQRAKRPELVRSGQFERKDLAKPAGPSVVVALFGSEHSPETLAELAEALAEGGRIEVVYLTELPEQTTVDALAAPEPGKVSVRRRVLAMAAARKLDLDFESITSRDVVETINTLTSKRQCKWLVTEWTRRGKGRFTFGTPLGWLRDHLGSNLATFYDGGVRTFREIMVHVEPGPHDALVLGTADHLAAVHGANLTFVRFVADGASATDLQAAADYLDQVREMCSAKRETLILRGGREDRALIEASGTTDLMITAGVAHSSLLSRIRGNVWDRVTESAACSVLQLRTPPVQGHTAFERYQGRVDEGARSLLDYIDERCVRAGLEPGRKEALFQSFAAAFAQLASELKPAEIVAGLWERERSQNTALGNGIALPHATLAASKRTHLGVFTTASPIDFDAFDGQGVDVFFVTMGPPGDRQEHLRLLGAIARLCSRTDLLARLRAAWSGAEMLEAIGECAAELDI